MPRLAKDPGIVEVGHFPALQEPACPIPPRQESFQAHRPPAAERPIGPHLDNRSKNLSPPLRSRARLVILACPFRAAGIVGFAPAYLPRVKPSPIAGIQEANQG